MIMNARFVLLTVVLLAPLAALAAVPPVLETADDAMCERPCVEHAAELPVTFGKAPEANQADRVLGVIRKGVLYVTKPARRTTADERPARPSTVESPDKRPIATARSVVIRCDDGQIAIASTHDDTFDVRVTTTDGGERHFAGSREAIIGQIGALPERLQTYIARGLRDQDPRAVEESEWPSRRGARSRGNHVP
jgi:hypothetical protein